MRLIRGLMITARPWTASEVSAKATEKSENLLHELCAFPGKCLWVCKLEKAGAQCTALLERGGCSAAALLRKPSQECASFTLHGKQQAWIPQHATI